MHVIEFSTNKKVEVIDITQKVEEIVKKEKVDEGICVIHAPHATAAIVLNENEEGLKEDIVSTIKDLFFNRNYKHNLIDNNGASHISSIFLGQTKVLPIHENKLVRGTWQNILFLELDGPRNIRRVVVWIQKKK